MRYSSVIARTRPNEVDRTFQIPSWTSPTSSSVPYQSPMVQTRLKTNCSSKIGMEQTKYRWLVDSLHWFVLLFTASTFLGAGMPITVRALSVLIAESLMLSGLSCLIRRATRTRSASAYID
eukprot:1177494-Prorocentrum_minimum.AAC.3